MPCKASSILATRVWIIWTNLDAKSAYKASIRAASLNYNRLQMKLTFELTKSSKQDSESISMQDWVQLSNGCACCTVKNDFVKALEDLMTRKGMYDYILIETTGVASPFFCLKSDQLPVGQPETCGMKFISQHLREKCASCDEAILSYDFQW